MLGGTSFSCLFVPVMARLKVAQLHMYCAKQCARAVVLRHQSMRRLAHFNCFGTPTEVPHNPAASGKHCGLNFGLLNAIACDAVDQLENCQYLLPFGLTTSRNPAPSGRIRALPVPEGFAYRTSIAVNLDFPCATTVSGKKRVTQIYWNNPLPVFLPAF